MTCRLKALSLLLFVWAQPAFGVCASHTLIDAKTSRPVSGIEDIAYLPNTDTVVLSAYDRRSGSEGGVYGLTGGDLSSASSQSLIAEQLVTPEDLGSPLRPHGIALHQGRDDITRLAVLNRRAWNGSRATDLLVFELNEDHSSAELTVQTRSASLCAANNIVFLDEETFLVSLDHAACGGARRMMEDVLNLARGSIVLVAPIGIRNLISGLRFPNGLALEEDRRRLWVASTRGKEVLAFQLPQRLQGAYQDNTPDQRIALSSAPDNLTLTPEGHLLAAGHQSLMAFAAYRADLPWFSPPGSAVELIDPQTRTAELALTLRDPLLNGATAAIRRGETIAAVGGFDNKLAVCDMRGLP